MSAIVPVSPSEYAIARTDISKVQHIIRVNLQGEAATEFDFDRIRVPAGGGISWAVPTPEGEENIKELEGIIIHHKLTRAYWQELYDAGSAGNPPDCSSPDALTGIGSPGGLCADCPNAAWGSDTRSKRAQSCKAIRLLFMVRKDDVIPVVVVVPPSSLSAVRKHLIRLTTRNIPHYGAASSLGLERTKNRDGIVYSRITCKMTSRLTEEMERHIYNYAEIIKPHLTATRAGAGDYDVHTDSPEGEVQ